jgi:hypothetical protein
MTGLGPPDQNGSSADAIVTRAAVASFFGLKTEHLPPEGSPGWQRLIATYLYARTPGFDIATLQRMLDANVYPRQAG